MTRRAPSLRRRLAVGLGLGIAALWLLTIAAVAVVVREEMDEIFDSALQETAERVFSLSLQELQHDPGAASARAAATTGRGEYLTYGIKDAQGRLILLSRDADAGVFEQATEEGFSWTAEYRLFTSTTIAGDFAIVMADPMKYRREAVREAVRAMVAPVFLWVPLSLFGIFWVVNHSLRPIQRLRTEVTERDGADLRPVTTEGLPEEVAVIAQAVNQLLARLKRTLEAERSFTANSAHELRTPIAASLAQTQRLIAEAADGPLAVRARQIEAQLQRLARLSEKLMQLARAEGGGVLGETPQDLSAVLAFIVDDFAKSGQADRLRLALPDRGALPSHLDPDAFGILARNLIENALRHGDQGQPVQVTMLADGTLSVANGGAVIAPDTLAHLTTRFARGEARSDGSGLGLAIADTIAKAAGARLQVYSPARGRSEGFEAVLYPVKSAALTP